MPNGHHDDIDQLFLDSLGGSERVPSLRVWENIEAELDSDKRRRLLLWWRPASIAVVLLLATSGVWLMRGSRHPVGSRTIGQEGVGSGTAFRLPSPKASPRNQRSASASLTLTTQPPFAVANPAASQLPFASIQTAEPPVVSGSGPSIARKALNCIPSIHLTTATLIRPVPLRHRFDLTAYISQDLAGYNFADHDSAGPSGSEIEKRQNTSFSRSVGLLVSYHLHHHWLVESGISVSRSVTISAPGKAVAVADNNGKASFLINTVTGFGYIASNGTTNIGDSAVAGKTTGKVDYVSLPLTVLRQWPAGRFSLLAGAGIDVDFLTRGTIQTSVTSATGATAQKEITQYGLRRVDYGWQLKGECRYRLTPTVAATVMTTFKNSVSPVNIHTPYSTYPYNLGIEVGITRTF